MTFSVVLLASERMTRAFPLRWLRMTLCRELQRAGIEVRALLIDAPPPPKPVKLGRLIKRHGEARVAQYQALVDGQPEVFEREHSYEAACAELGIPLHILDLNSEAAQSLIADLAPDLGLLFGCRILGDATIDAPRLGTLNFHGRDAEVYRGGGALGYWELLEGESAIEVTIHKAVAKVDAGAILAKRAVRLEPCDTLESVVLKALMQGVGFYAEATADYAAGRTELRPQSSARARTYRRDLVGETIFRAERRELLRKMARYAEAPLPVLSAPAPGPWRGDEARALILAYPAIANDAEHPLNLPFEAFYAQVEWLSRYLPIVSLSEARERLRTGPPEPCAVITLDGGLAQDAVATLPCLAALDLPATLFIDPEASQSGGARFGKPLLDPAALGALATSPRLDFGLFAGARDEDEERLLAWTGRPCVGQAAPLGGPECGAGESAAGLILDLASDGEDGVNAASSFDGRRLTRRPAPSCLSELARLVERAFGG